jgi:LPS O-antigen subunit length determinant protein (WzzB/FepE family)
LQTLEGRTSDDPFIPELVSLNNQINEIQNNNLLQTLEERQDDSPFIARINELDIESAKLKSFVMDMTGIDAMQIQQSASAQSMPISPGRNNWLLIVLALFGGFVMSIILAFLINLFKEEEIEQKNK